MFCPQGREKRPLLPPPPSAPRFFLPLRGLLPSSSLECLSAGDGGPRGDEAPQWEGASSKEEEEEEDRSGQKRGGATGRRRSERAWKHEAEGRGLFSLSLSVSAGLGGGSPPCCLGGKGGFPSPCPPPSPSASLRPSVCRRGSGEGGGRGGRPKRIMGPGEKGSRKGVSRLREEKQGESYDINPLPKNENKRDTLTGALGP